MARGWPDWQRAPAEAATAYDEIAHVVAHNGNFTRNTLIRVVPAPDRYRVLGHHLSVAIGVLAAAGGGADQQIALRLAAGIPGVSLNVIDAWAFDVVSPVSTRTVYNLDLGVVALPGSGFRSNAAGDDLYIQSVSTGSTNVSATDFTVRGVVALILK